MKVPLHARAPFKLGAVPWAVAALAHGWRWWVATDDVHFRHHAHAEALRTGRRLSLFV